MNAQSKVVADQSCWCPSCTEMVELETDGTCGCGTVLNEPMFDAHCDAQDAEFWRGVREFEANQRRVFTVGEYGRS